MSMINEIYMDYEPRKELAQFMPEINSCTEMSEEESAFLCGLLEWKRPKKILEIGVASGGTTAIIMKCMEKVDKEYILNSIDKSKKCYRGRTELPTGYLCEKANDLISFTGKKNMFLGGILPDYLNEIGDEIDFVVLDTVHSLPGEILDFLVLLPKLQKDAVIVLHDISLNQRKQEYRFSDATNVLLHSVCGEKILNFFTYGTGGSSYPNIGAFQLTTCTWPNIIDVFMALTIRWRYFPDAVEISKYETLIHKIYNKKTCRLFDCAVQMNARNMFPMTSKVRKGMKVILYGAGSMGAAYWYQLKDFCSIIGWVDRDAGSKHGLDCKIFYPSDINYEFADVVLIAVKNKNTVAEIEENLVKMGVPKEKIICEDDVV